MPLEIPVQPPPDAPAAAPGKAAKRSWWIAGLLLVLAVISCSYLYQMFLNRHSEANRRELIGNMRSLGYSLSVFDADFGSYPTDTTQAELRSATGDAAWASVTSNDLLRQLIVYGTRTERIFSDNGLSGWTRRPDDVFSPLSKALEPGECAYAYIPGNSAGSPDRPLLLYPMIAGTLRFDPKPLRGEALILRNDCMVDSFPIGKDGRVMLGGKDLFDPSQPMWGGVKPDVRLPAK